MSAYFVEPNPVGKLFDGISKREPEDFVEMIIYFIGDVDGTSTLFPIRFTGLLRKGDGFMALIDEDGDDIFSIPCSNEDLTSSNEFKYPHDSFFIKGKTSGARNIVFNMKDFSIHNIFTIHMSGWKPFSPPFDDRFMKAFGHLERREFWYTHFWTYPRFGNCE